MQLVFTLKEVVSTSGINGDNSGELDTDVREFGPEERSEGPAFLSVLQGHNSQQSKLLRMKMDLIVFFPQRLLF